VHVVACFSPFLLDIGCWEVLGEVRGEVGKNFSQLMTNQAPESSRKAHSQQQQPNALLLPVCIALSLTHSPFYRFYCSMDSFVLLIKNKAN